MLFWYLGKKFWKQRGDPLKNFIPHRTDFDLVTLSLRLRLRLTSLTRLRLVIHTNYFLWMKPTSKGICLYSRDSNEWYINLKVFKNYFKICMSPVPVLSLLTLYTTFNTHYLYIFINNLFEYCYCHYYYQKYKSK